MNGNGEGPAEWALRDIFDRAATRLPTDDTASQAQLDALELPSRSTTTRHLYPIEVVIRAPANPEAYQRLPQGMIQEDVAEKVTVGDKTWSNTQSLDRIVTQVSGSLSYRLCKCWLSCPMLFMIPHFRVILEVKKCFSITTTFHAAFAPVVARVFTNSVCWLVSCWVILPNVPATFHSIHTSLYNSVSLFGLYL
jgi:hypothetical protein